MTLEMNHLIGTEQKHKQGRESQGMTMEETAEEIAETPSHLHTFHYSISHRHKYLFQSVPAHVPTHLYCCWRK